MEIETHELKYFYNLNEFLDFVKRHKNVFNDRTIHRSYEVGYWYIVKEFNYFDGKKTIWFWLFNFKDPTNKTYIIIPDTYNFKPTELIEILEGGKYDI